MTDLPREGEVVLAFWSGYPYMAKLEDGSWYWSTLVNKHEPSWWLTKRQQQDAPDWWLPLSLARHARGLLRVAEAALRVIQVDAGPDGYNWDIDGHDTGLSGPISDCLRSAIADAGGHDDE